MVNITYADLIELRNNACLIPGMQYRITDYVTTTSQENTQSAGHQFDIIVTADSENTLNEKARAIQHDGDTYFADSNLDAWEIWYSLDNDTERFAWANTKIIESAAETIIANSSECTIKSDLIDGNTFITPFNFESCVWVDADEKNSGYTTADNHDIDELVYEWNYFDNPKTGNTELCIYKSDADIYEEEGCADSGDKYVYRGLVIVDGKEYDYWQKYESNQDGEYDELTIAGDGYVYATTPRIVSNPEAYSYEIFTLESKGIIYRMIDEFNNDCPYDFKNIQFKHPNDTTTYPDNYYTFSIVINGVVTDYSMLQDYCYGNTIKEYITSKKQNLNNNVFLNTSKSSCNSNSFGNNCYSNSFGNDCNSNSFGNSCKYNSFVNSCFYNSFGNSCQSNSFGSNCYSNSFGDGCKSNSFGNDCNSNSFGSNCYSNSFGYMCSYNSFGNNCHDNSFGNYYDSNSFGNDCYYNSFRTHADKMATLKDYVQYNHFDDGCSYNVICNSDITSSSSTKLKNINVNRGVSGTSSEYNFINIVDKNAAYEIKVAKNSKGEIKIYCEADLIV